MLSLNCLLLVALAANAFADQAPAVNDNPTNIVAIADFPQSGKHTEILGTMKFFSTNGTVKVHWDVTQLPKKKGPFQYHIHENPVGVSSNCENAGLHFNPYQSSANCDEYNDDSFCQVGDLSGKHGFIDTTCFETSYYDQYLSLKPEDASYIIGKSVVIHYPNLKKIACADIKISGEDVKRADRESKQNLRHNKDLVEASIPDYTPADAEELELQEQAHQEWLIQHPNGEDDTHALEGEDCDGEEEETNSEDDCEGEDSESGYKYYEADKQESETYSGQSSDQETDAKLGANKQNVKSNSKKVAKSGVKKSEIKKGDKNKNANAIVAKQGYEKVYPEEEFANETQQTTDCENAAAVIVTGYGLFASCVATLIGFLI